MEKSTATLFLATLSTGIIVLNIFDVVDLRIISVETVWLFLFLFFSAVWAFFFKKFDWVMPHDMLLPKIYTTVSVLMYILLLIIFLLCIIPKNNIALFDAGWPKYVGILMVIEAFVFLASSQYQFHKVFSEKPSNTTVLVTHGIYRLNRHPYYLGLIELGFSCALTFNSLFSIAGVLVLYILVYWLSCMEEKLLKISFGEKWENYRSTTPGLLLFK